MADKRDVHRIACLPAILALSFAILGAGPRYSFRHYGQADGLDSLDVRALLQDRQGFLWVGTARGGLFRYDGTRFKRFGAEDGLPSATVWGLSGTDDGTLWVSTDAGLARRIGERFEPLKVPGAKSVRQSVATGAEGRIYATGPCGLYAGRQRGEAWEFARVWPAGAAACFETLAVYRDSGDALWFSCGTGVCRLSRGLVQQFGIAQGLPGDQWQSITRPGAAGAIVLASRARVFEWRPGEGRFQPVRLAVPPSYLGRVIIADRRGRLLIPTDSGLARISGEHIETIGKAQGLLSDSVGAVLQDREGSVWVGMRGAGLARWLGYDQWESWTASEGLANDQV